MRYYYDVIEYMRDFGFACYDSIGMQAGARAMQQHNEIVGIVIAAKEAAKSMPKTPKDVYTPTPEEDFIF